jgi:tetratricopeptide (TPR) repeat protein
MLGTLLSKAGEDTNVVLMSDHGFHPDHLRPRGIPDFPAGPAIEHSPFGIFVMAGPGIRKDETLFGVSVLDLAPTLLALYGLPAGEDMDGRVVTAAFENPPALEAIPSWEDVPGEDGRHPPHTRLDPVAAAEALGQLVALGYIEKPGGNIEEYVESTVRELRYNLLEAYQDANRHAEALDIARDLCSRNPDDQRYALKRFLSSQALGLVAEMRGIVDDMSGRRRQLYLEAVERMKAFRELAKQRYNEKKIAASETPDPEECERELTYELNPRAEPDEPRDFLLQPEERRDLQKTILLHRYQPAITDLLEAHALTAEKRWFEALEVLRRLDGAQLMRPAILLQSADLLRRLGRLPESEQAYRRALVLDPDNTHAYLGLCRLALRRRDYEGATKAATDCTGRLYFYPMAHLMEGIARIGLGDYGKANTSLRTALSQNPHFPQAHLWLARLLKFRLNDPAGADEHFRWYREMRRTRPARSTAAARPKVDSPVRSTMLRSTMLRSTMLRSTMLRSTMLRSTAAPRPDSLQPALGEDVLVVCGLPRSGTSMLMQMLDAGGMPILTDQARTADEDNPKGYFEFEAVRKMFRDQGWVGEARGKAVKIVTPLVCSLPTGGRYRVLLIERDYDEILASQAKMIARRGEPVADSPERRERLRREYARLIDQTREVLGGRPDVELLTLFHEDTIRWPQETAEIMNRFAGGSLDTSRMASAVDRSLYRNRRA